MLSTADKVREATEVLQKNLQATPKAGLILGTGLDGVADAVKKREKFDYEQIPHFPGSGAHRFHTGDFLAGEIEGVAVICMQGRFHLYEGYSMEEITLPIRVMRALGAEYLLVSNACGGLNPLFALGDLMMISDHINFMGSGPLLGPHDERLGGRFPDMIEPYSAELRRRVKALAMDLSIPVKEGVYIGVQGPQLETRAEYRMMRAWGADVVGMSTVPEVIVAVQEGFQTLGLSIVTDMCLPDALHPASIDEIIRVAKGAEPAVTRLVTRFVASLGDA